MSRGLSEFQREIMERMEKDKHLGLMEVGQMYWSKKGGEIPEPRGYRWKYYGNVYGNKQDGRSHIKNVKSLYRAMKTLEKRGLIGKPFCVYPMNEKHWYIVTWDGEVPTIWYDKDEVKRRIESDKKSRYYSGFSINFWTKGRSWKTAIDDNGEIERTTPFK